MKSYFIPFLTVASISISVAPRLSAKELDPKDFKSIHYCYLYKKRYAFVISNKLYEKMRHWNIGSDNPPPISPQKAFGLAKNRLNKISITKGCSWTFEEATLQPINRLLKDGKWIWKLSFRYNDKRFSAGTPVRMKFLVTMDGFLVEPIVTERK